MQRPRDRTKTYDDDRLQVVGGACCQMPEIILSRNHSKNDVKEIENHGSLVNSHSVPLRKLQGNVHLFPACGRLCSRLVMWRSRVTFFIFTSLSRLPCHLSIVSLADNWMTQRGSALTDPHLMIHPPLCSTQESTNVTYHAISCPLPMTYRGHQSRFLCS